MREADDAIRQAIEVFVHGYCFGRSLTFPHLPAQVEGLWVLRDATRANPIDYRKEEWIAFDVPPESVDRIAKQHTRGRFFICAVSAQDASEGKLRDEYKRLGYRLLTTEPLFVHSLRRIPRVSATQRDAAPAVVYQVDSLELAERFAKANRSRPMTPAQLERHAPFRQYVAIADEAIVGWVRSVRVGASAWVANMQVEEAFRRRGIASAMLERLLREDRYDGVGQSVLLASRSGALLYPQLGYKRIGAVLIFAPRKA